MSSTSNSFRNLVRRRPRWTPQNRHSYVQAIASNGSRSAIDKPLPSITEPEADVRRHTRPAELPEATKQLKPHLIPVPSIRNALFEPITRRPSWYTSLNCREDALRLCDQQWLHPHKYAEPWPAKNMVEFNGLVSRMQRLGVDLPPSKILYAIQLAVNEPAAMKAYLEMLANGPKQVLTGLDTELENTMSYISERICVLGHPQSKFTTPSREASKWLEVVTGFRYRGVQEVDEERQPSIYHLMLACGDPVLHAFAPNTPWPRYLHLVSMFGGKDATYVEWLDFKLQISATTKDESINAAQNAVIQALVNLGDSERAWHVTYEARDLANDISHDTWKQLLRHPQGVSQWIPEIMDTPAISMLSEELEELERFLGIEWKGGEDGYHVVDHDPFWVRSDEGFDEGEALHRKKGASVHESKTWRT